MANPSSPSGGSPGNPVVDVEATNVDVAPDFTLNAVRLEVTDQAGDGFRTFFSFDQALDTAMRIIGSIARLRGWSVP
jgi:hypothetical protein